MASAYILTITSGPHINPVVSTDLDVSYSEHTCSARHVRHDLGEVGAPISATE